MTDNGGKTMVTHDRAWPLYGAAFTTALSLGICWTAMPFVLSAIGGTEAHVGYAPAANSFAYMIALVLTGSMLGHLDVKKATRTAIVVALLAALLMALAVSGATRSEAGGGAIWIWSIVAAGGLGGAAMALFWPFLMSWVSSHFEGVQLNRRLGRYNGSWSGGAIVGPLVGASLVEIGVLVPMVTAVVSLIFSFVLLNLARNGASPSSSTTISKDDSISTQDSRILANYRWMSRISLFCAWATHAIARSQFALVFVGLGYSEARFGIFLTLFAACNCLSLMVAGRWAFWHFKPVPLIVAQVTFLVSLLAMIYSRTLLVLYPSAVILGLAFGFAYSSHLYYGASGSRQRSVRMTIHELVISLGIVVGSASGGYLAKNIGSTAPYWFAIGLICVGLVLQLAIHIISLLVASSNRRSEPSSSVTL